MKTLTLGLVLAASSQSFAAPATSETRIIDNVVRFARTIYPIERSGLAFPMAAISGNVRFQGFGPVYVSLYVGGQAYTALTDDRGDYSFFVFTNGGGRYDVRAWTDSDSKSVSVQSGDLEVQK
jgi:hypothetical protein